MTALSVLWLPVLISAEVAFRVTIKDGNVAFTARALKGAPR
jgi:hypothetical protein